MDEGGQRYEDAWKEVAPSPYLECPKYPISIPKSWSSTISFRSGDYDAVTEEVIEFQVSEKQCELHRLYRTGWPGKSEWTHEVWENFSHKEAEHFFAALIYAIDNPWFYGSDKLSNLDNKMEGIKIGGIRGRPKAWTDYYPGYEWTGILDNDQKVIVNHDPWNWDTIDHELGTQTSLNGVGCGVVFRLVRDLFPDPSWIPTKSRWKKVDPPKTGLQGDDKQPARRPEAKL